MKRSPNPLVPLLAALILTTLACQTVLAPLTRQTPEAAPRSTPRLTQPAPVAPSATRAVTDGEVDPCKIAAQPPDSDPGLPANPSHASIGDPFAPELGNLGYDVLHYTLALSLDPGQPGRVCGTVTLLAEATDAIEEFALDFIGFGIASLQVNGAEAEYYRTADKVVILLDARLQPGDSFDVRIAYGGQTVEQQSRFAPFEDSLGLFFPGPGNLYALSEPDGSRFWFPSNDHPRDKALFRFEITTPAGLMAVANGLLVDRIDSRGSTTWVWEHADLMATYLATVAVGDYSEVQNEVVGALALRSYALPSADARMRDYLARTEDAIPWMEEMVGPYPFEAYGYVTVDSGGVTLETQSLVALSTFMIHEAVLVHELAHMWFGNHVSLDSWGEMWRNEGFATYFEYMWDFRDDPAGFAREMDLLVAAVEADPTLEPLNALTPANLFGYESYVKGAAVIHALRGEVGDEAFFAGLRLYLERFGGGTASDEDFIAVMEEVSGQDLSTFFGYWLGD